MPTISDIDKAVSDATGHSIGHWREQPWWPKSARVQVSHGDYEDTCYEGTLTVFIPDYQVLILKRISAVITAAFTGWKVANHGPYIDLLSDKPSFDDQETAARVLTALGMATTYTKHNALYTNQT